MTVLRFFRRFRETLRLMIGLPDYDRYVEHLKLRHPERSPMTYAEFFRERQEARYGSSAKSGRCC